MVSYALDSSVLVASLIPQDRNYDGGAIVVRRIVSGNDTVYASAIVPVEVCAALARRTRDRASAEEAGRQISKWVRLGRLHILYLTQSRMKRAREIGIECFVRGMDAIVLQVAEEKKISFVTFDQELAERARTLVRTITQDEITEEMAS